MIHLFWNSIGEKSALVLSFTHDPELDWDDYRQVAAQILQLQAAQGSYPANIIFDLRECHADTPEILYYLKKLLALRSMPNLHRLTILGNRKRHHMLAAVLNGDMPFTVTFARDFDAVQPAVLPRF